MFDDCGSFKVVDGRSGWMICRVMHSWIVGDMAKSRRGCTGCHRNHNIGSRIDVQTLHRQRTWLPRPAADDVTMPAH